MPRVRPRARMRIWRALSLEHSSRFIGAIDAYGVCCGLFVGYHPSDIRCFWRAAWSDERQMHRTIAQRGSGGLARRFALRCGRGLLAGYGVPCRDDVHWSTLGIPGRPAWCAPGAAGVWALFTIISVLLPFVSRLPIMLALLVL